MSETMDETLLRLFSGLPQQGPGTDADTIAALELVEGALPDDPSVVDFGCGTGRSTLALARRLAGGRITAIDALPAFIDALKAEAAARGLSSRIEARVGDMARPAMEEASVDLVWCEGAAYAIGFEEALGAWRPLLRPDGRCVVSECEWFTGTPPAAVAAFWRENYPRMTDRAGNLRRARAAGYEVLATRTLSDEGWERYYSAVAGAIRSGCAGPPGSDLVASLAGENDIWRRSEDSFGYVFYILRPM